MFSIPARPKTVVTPTMREVRSLTLSGHHLSEMVLWSGRSRLGKTTTALWLTGALNTAYDQGKEEFRCVYYETGIIQSSNPQAHPKWAIRGLIEAVVGKVDFSMFRQQTAEQLAVVAVETLRQRAIEVVIVDEAGMLSTHAMRGLALVRNIADKSDTRLTIVMVGMDDITVTVGSCAQLAGRVRTYCYFKPLDVDQTWDLLRHLDEFVAGLDPHRNRGDVEFIHNTGQGVPGLMLSLLAKGRVLADTIGEPMKIGHVRAAHIDQLNGRKAIDADLGIRRRNSDMSA